MAELTATDIADYTVTMRDPSFKPMVIRAAYTSHDGEFVTLKDHQHKTMAMVRSDAVAYIQRQQCAESDLVARYDDPLLETSHG